MGTKVNPGEFDCYANAKPDEPMFVLLGRDNIAPMLVMKWAAEYAEKKGGLAFMKPEQFEKYWEARRLAHEMLDWKKVNPDA